MNARGALAMATLYLIIYATLVAIGYADIAVILFFASPLILLGTALIVLTDNRQKYPELDKNQEWGYRDSLRDDLGVC
ncbi:hypothetical protein [Mucilaginibacter ginsenosidivorax]|uniref:Uncharacterized protein n=1 Tax=Mucilaginibacter ginsenosidivorax TaxID=862126 RepID=A0A5B8W936_9SPHI|nr:hypothetical protein [Mucilaginibacter ginsenosidivorax]QEC79475.1 hypothetical protein FSB76_27290 [Mucilaginibacter ginsenosidivorax]